jgi:uncharacterized protein (TIGR02246 family)
MNAKTIQARVTRRFTASAERVFDAFLDPSKAGRFMFATPTGQMVRVAIDPRVGGNFIFVDRRDGEDVEHSGKYVEIERPRRLVFTLTVPKYSKNVDRVTIDITPLASGCELTLVHEMGAEFAEMRPRTESGWAGILEGLEATLDDGEDVKAIRALLETWMSATRAGELDTVLDLMTEDVVFLGPGRPPMIGRESFAAATRAQIGNAQIDGKSEIQEIRIAGNWAYMWTRLSVVMAPSAGGAPVKRAGHTLSVLRKENGKWRLARDANMLAVTPE